jgi:hypothetical protein
MDAHAETDVLVSAPPLTGTGPQSNTHRRRRVDYDSGRALEILGHAIDYLTDEYILEGGKLSADDPGFQAVQILMALNRQIYFARPVVPTLSERLFSFLRLRRA